MYLALALVTLVRPRWGVFCFWSASWCYPINLLQGLLPLNIRFDDLLLIWCTICVSLLPRPIWRPKSQLLPLLWVWWLAWLLGNLSGWLTGYDDVSSLIRSLGKAAYIPIMGYLIWRTTHRPRDVELHVWSIIVAGVLAAAIGILSVRSPALVEMWEIPYWKFGIATWESGALSTEFRRAGGSLGIMYLAFTCMSLALVCTRLLIQPRSIMIGVLAAIAAGINLVGLLYTNTRGCIGGFGIGVLYMLLRQRKRGLVLLCGFAGILFVIVGTDLVQRVSERLSGRVGVVSEAGDERVAIWRRYMIEMPTPEYFFFGRGWAPEKERVGINAHSSYVGAIAYTGIFGFVVTTVLFVRIWRVGVGTSSVAANSFDAVLGESMRVVVISTLFAGIFVEEIFAHHMRLVGALAVLCEHTVYFRQWNAWAALQPGRWIQPSAATPHRAQAQPA